MTQPIRNLKPTDKLIITAQQAIILVDTMSENLKAKHWGLMHMLHNLPILPDEETEKKKEK